MVRTASEVKGYQHKILHDNGDVTYHNGLRGTAELDIIMSRCWDSLPDCKKREINRRSGGD